MYTLLAINEGREPESIMVIYMTGRGSIHSVEISGESADRIYDVIIGAIECDQEA